MPKQFIRLPQGDDGGAFASMLERRGRAGGYRSKRLPEVLIADVSDEDRKALEHSGAEVYDDIEFDIFPGDPGPDGRRAARYWEPPIAEADAAADAVPGLREVLAQIRAPEAWQRTRGRGVTIAIVDTGICPTLREFPPSRRSPVDLPSAYAGKHWKDTKGHGSMCAVIASGSAAAGHGRFNGVAPEATVLAARSTLVSSDVYAIYDALIDARANGTIPGPLVISNSYGLYVCDPPAGLPEDHPYLQIVLAAVDAGIPVVFAAGNNHYDVKCNHDPTACGPNSIWAVNSHDRILSVGTVDKDLTNRNPANPHVNSSRGPGQWANVHKKPDCVAPTYGEVAWGCDYRPMAWWGTSGACPQVAGLAALILSVNPGLSPQQVGDIIRSTCRSLSAPETCVGAGLIDCEAAVGAA